MFIYIYLQGKLWDWDSAEADQMLLAGADTLPPGAPILSGGGGGGGGGQMSQGGDDNLDFDPQDAIARGQSANKQRAPTANSMNARPGTAVGSWGFGENKAHPVEDQAAYDAKAAAATSRSAGSLHRDGKDDDGPQRRPHTAHGGRVEQGEGDEENGHVVAGARAMMQYRRTRSGQPEPTQSAPAPAAATSSNSNTRWASGLFSSGNNDAAKAQSSAVNQASAAKPVSGMRKV